MHVKIPQYGGVGPIQGHVICYNLGKRVLVSQKRYKIEMLLMLLLLLDWAVDTTDPGL